MTRGKGGLKKKASRLYMTGGEGEGRNFNSPTYSRTGYGGRRSGKGRKRLLKGRRVGARKKKPTQARQTGRGEKGGRKEQLLPQHVSRHASSRRRKAIGGGLNP